MLTRTRALEHLCKVLNATEDELLAVAMEECSTAGKAIGLCRDCGQLYYDLEPDATGYTCHDACGSHCVESVLVTAGLI